MAETTKVEAFGPQPVTITMYVDTSGDVTAGSPVIHASGDRNVIDATADSVVCSGIALTSGTATGAAVTVLLQGTIRLVAGAAITAGASIATAGSGKVKAADAYGKKIGRALETSSQDTDVILCWISV